MDLGCHYVILAVDNLYKSIDFYEKLGFQLDNSNGGIEEKWVMMQNGPSKIGLFQDMFPSNLLAFQSQDARMVSKSLAEKGIDLIMASKLDLDSGPCHFVIQDPDGNIILFDQRV